MLLYVGILFSFLMTLSSIMSMFWKEQPKISELYIYPIKSCGGILLEEACIDEFGFEFDRNWILAEYKSGNWEMITQRTFSKLVLVRPLVKKVQDEIVLLVNAPGMEELMVSLQEGVSVTITVWDDKVMGIIQSKESCEWFSRYLGIACSLFHKDKKSVRSLIPKHTPNKELFSHEPQTAFADGFPFLLLSEASVEEFKRLHPEPNVITTKTFRPNIVISGVDAYAEDSYLEFTVNGTTFYGVARCTRCTMTNNNTITGIPGSETLKLLQKTRRVDPGAKYEGCMGMNVIQSEVGTTIRVGDPILVSKVGIHDRRGIWNGQKEASQ
jgi:uncharacterized protein YcbX